MMKIAVLTAMESEFLAVADFYGLSSADKFYLEFSVGGKEILLQRSGIGKVNAALAADELCRRGADVVITTGLAGGIGAGLKRGDIVLADRVCYHDVWCGEPNAIGQVQDMPLYYKTSAEFLRQITSVAPAYKTGLTVTGDQFLTDTAALAKIKHNFPEVLAVDMESAAVAQTCYIKHRPYLSLRIISDVAGHPEQEEQYKNFWKEMPQQAAQMLNKTINALSSD